MRLESHDYPHETTKKWGFFVHSSYAILQPVNKNNAKQEKNHERGFNEEK
jgi:hypothetical protein